MADFVGAIDQGTTSTRFMIFDHDGNEVGRHQLEHEQILPRAGWVEHDPVEIWERTERGHRRSALNAAGLARRPTSPRSASPTSARPPSCGTARPAGRYYNAIVWQDTRTDRIAAPLERDGRGDVDPAAGRACRRPPTSPAARSSGSWRTSTGCARPPSAATRSSAPPTRWLLWNLTGGVDGGVHVTDVTNASRTMLMDLETLDWDDELLGVLRHPARDAAGDPAVARTPSRYGMTLAGRPARRRGAAHRRPRRPAGRHRRPGLLRRRRGQEHLRHRQLPAAQHRRRSWSARSTACSPRSATSSATRRRSTRSRARSPSPARPCSGCATSSASSPAPRRARALARQVEDNGGVYFVPAFSGLFAPYWRSDARGAIVGLSRFNTNAHLARATLEAICYQSRDVVEAMEQDSGVAPRGAQGRRRRHRQRPVHADPGRHPRRRR